MTTMPDGARRALGLTPEEHQAEHRRLHHALDLLLACYIGECRSGNGSGSIHNSILQLLEWAHQKTMLPTPADTHDDRDPVDFESQRQMIVLALAELALSRPGFEASIREIARHYDVEGLPMFEGFKGSSADRVRAERGPFGPMIAQQDDPELLEWLINASAHAGGFLSTLADAALRADGQNYPILRPAILDLRAKYPKFERGQL